jgi:hypothetical protein
MNGSTNVSAFTYLLNAIVRSHFKGNRICFDGRDFGSGRDGQSDGRGSQVFDIDQHSD